MNFHSVHLVFPLKIKKTNVANDILATEIMVNNFFAHWIKEIDIKRLDDDIPTLPTTNMINIYRYSDAMLKHLSKKRQKSLKTICYILKKKLSCLTMKMRRANKRR